MKDEAFRKLTNELEKLTPHRQQLLSDRLRTAGQARVVRNLVESRVLEHLSCLHCKHEKVSRWGSASGLQRYRCGACKATINTLTGTPLARLRNKYKWLKKAPQMAQDNSVRKNAQACEAHRNTALRWRHRFLQRHNTQQATRLAGIADADETFFFESAKDKKRGLARAPRKRGGKAPKRGLSDEKIPVLICRDRIGNTADFVLKKSDKEHIGAVLKPILASDAIALHGWGRALGAVARKIGVCHRSVNLAAGVRVITGVYPVQNVNACGSRLQEWMRRFHGVATCHPANHLG